MAQHLAVQDDLKQSNSVSSIVSDNDNLSPETIPFSMNVKHTVAKLHAERSRKVMIAMDNSEFSQKAINWVNANLLRNDDAILLISIWEEAMVNTLIEELDSEIIHPSPAKPVAHSKHADFHHTFSQAQCFKNHKKLTALLVESSARVNTKTIGEELCDFADKMKIDVLVCGTRGLGSIKKAFLGSVSTYVTGNAKCTTIIVK
eukprot:480265_1